jgi:hypothetical protein
MKRGAAIGPGMEDVADAVLDQLSGSANECPKSDCGPSVERSGHQPPAVSELDTGWRTRQLHGSRLWMDGDRLLVGQALCVGRTKSHFVVRVHFVVGGSRKGELGDASPRAGWMNMVGGSGGQTADRRRC